MDGNRFDDLARLFASPTSRRGAIKGLVGSWLGLAGIAAVGGDAGVQAAPMAMDVAEEPVDALGQTRLPRRRLVRAVAAPSTRPASKGRSQVAAAGTPVMTLSPTSGKIKTLVTAKLSGFRSNEAITLHWFDGSVAKTVATGTTSSGGKATITFVAPYAVRGYHVIRATGSRGSSADARFAIIPSFTLSPRKGPRGASVKAQLSGFAKMAAIDVRFYPTETAVGTPIVVTHVTVSGTGTGSVTFPIPNGAALGIHRIEGKERVSGRIASAKFTVQCSSASQCPGDNTECGTVICSSGVCGMDFAVSGTVVANQTSGDCHLNVCDGAGAVVSIVDDTDVPDDDNGCTIDTCSNGTVVHTNEAIGTPCGDGNGTVCDGQGVCLGCNAPTDCPGTDSECASRICTNGTCGTTFVPSGTAVASQTAGDCKKNVCDGEGAVVVVNDNTDLPIDDNQCTDSICTNGVPSTIPVSDGTSCDQEGGSVCVSGACLVCHPNATQSCYSGPVGTQNVGICTAGIQTCASDGSDWGPCQGETTSAVEICNGQDDNCDGIVDNGGASLCPPAIHGTAICTGASGCQIMCNAGYDNCDGNIATGCERNLMTDVQNCGRCALVCPEGPGEVAVCMNGVCGVM